MANGYERYQQNQFQTASPGKLLLLAYDGAIRFCKVAGEKMKEQQYSEQCTYINKATAIVVELASTLREEVDPVLCARLKSIYVYVLDKLSEANLNQDQKALDEAIKILSDLRETWAEADKKCMQEQSTQNPTSTEVAA